MLASWRLDCWTEFNLLGCLVLWGLCGCCKYEFDGCGWYFIKHGVDGCVTGTAAAASVVGGDETDDVNPAVCTCWHFCSGL